MSAISFGNLAGPRALHFQPFNPLTDPQASTVRALLQALDGFEGGGAPFSPSQLQLPPPPGYMKGATAQSMAQAAAFLQGLMASQILDVSIGSRMLLSLGLFQTGAFSGGPREVSQGSLGVAINGFSSRGTESPEKDRFAVHESCRTGADNPSNLNNSPHVKLALHNILKDNADNMPPEQL